MRMLRLFSLTAPFDLQTLNGVAKLETKTRSAIAKVGADDLISRPQ